MSFLKSTAAALALGGAILIPVACAQEHVMSGHPNSIQPETTISISASASVDREPDIAFLSGGVTTEADTAQAALAQNAQDMNGLFEALEEAGVERRHIQTSNFSLQPRYTYPRSSSGEQQRKLVGYTASNQVSVKVTDLPNVGRLIDAMVAKGGNTFNGVSFGLEDAEAVQDEARKLAITEALARAELYADASGYRVKRIVTIHEASGYDRPQPMMAARAMDMAESAPTPIAGGEVSYSANVNVTFELER